MVRRAVLDAMIKRAGLPLRSSRRRSILPVNGAVHRRNPHRLPLRGVARRKGEQILGPVVSIPNARNEQVGAERFVCGESR